MSKSTATAEEGEISRWNHKRRHSDGTGYSSNWSKKQLKTSMTGEIKLRAIREFVPTQMRYRERIELQNILKSERQAGFTCIFRNQMVGSEQWQMSNEGQGHQHVYLRTGSESENAENKYIELPIEVSSCEKDVADVTDWKKGERHSVELEQEDGDQRPTSIIDLDETYNGGEEDVDVSAETIPFKRGDQLVTVDPANIGDNVGWWKVKHFSTGNVGFIPRNRAVVENDWPASKTTPSKFPMEVLDIILENSFLQCMLRSSPHERNEVIVKSLASVDFCWFQRITRRRFKQRIWHRLKDFYGKTRKRCAIIRNNRNYLLENIQPNDEFISSLLSLKCITEEQHRIIQRRRLSQDKNDELLNILISCNQTKSLNFARCLRRTDQKAVARILEDGGVVIEAKVINIDGAKCVSAMNAQMQHQVTVSHINRSKPILHETDEFINQLMEDGAEILNSVLNREVIWIWCHAQSALDSIHRLYTSNQLRDVLFRLASTRPSTFEITQIRMIDIDCNEFKKTVVVCEISITLIERIHVGTDEFVFGVTKLGSEIYVLCPTLSATYHVIRVFEDRRPFLLLQKIDIKEIAFPWDIGSSDKDNCLYVSDSDEGCFWKITRATDDDNRLITRLPIYAKCVAFSVTSDGRLLLVNSPLSILMIYGSDGKCLRSIRLPRDVDNPRRAVETSFGNFIIIHEWMEEIDGMTGLGRTLEADNLQKRFQIPSRGRVSKALWAVSELTRDGEIIRSFPSLNNRQTLTNLQYLSLDSSDRVFVADYENGRVILLDSDLEMRQILCPATEEEETEIRRPLRLCYDEEKQQLIVGGDSQLFGLHVGDGFHIYTLNGY